MLVVNQRRHQDFLRQFEERPIEEPGDDARILDEIGHFVDERRMLLQLHATAQAPGVELERADDALASLPVIEDDEVLFEAGAGTRRSCEP